jgi:hypothetical protein
LRSNSGWPTARWHLHARAFERAERGEGMPWLQVRTLEAITQALEAGGVSASAYGGGEARGGAYRDFNSHRSPDRTKASQALRDDA